MDAYERRFKGQQAEQPPRPKQAQAQRKPRRNIYDEW